MIQENMWKDKSTRILFRFTATMFSGVLITTIIYDLVLPILSHDNTIMLGIVLGISLSLIIQYVIYKRGKKFEQRI